VNEVESLEALIQAKGGIEQCAITDADSNEFLEDFWKYRLDHLIQIALTRFNVEL